LLAALETGVHTSDFGDPTLPGYAKPVGTEEFTKAIIGKLGEQPKTVKPMPVPEQSTPTVQRPPKPSDQLMLRTFANVANEVVGADLYVEASMSVPNMAEAMKSLAEGTPFRLTLISNRGTQVWPTGSIYTECVDYHCVRFEVREDVKPSTVVQQDAVNLMVKTAASFTVSTYELLRNFDGVRGYSLAQGQ